MKIEETIMKRPQRWDEPLGPEMTAVDVERLRGCAPFSTMDATAFSKHIPLDGVLKNDCRILKLKKGDIVVREGDYGSSAFLILQGSCLVSLKSLPANILGRSTTTQKGWFQALSQLWSNSKFPEVRDYGGQEFNRDIGSRRDGESERVFLYDIPRVISPSQSVELEQGEVFGELSALTRTPRSATVVANSDVELVEIRWQGFREFLRRDPALRAYVDKLYRENSLRVHLREIELFRRLPTIGDLAEVTEFESFGDFEWNREFKSIAREDVAKRILKEPLIAQAGDYPDGLILIRSGFARLSRQHGDGHRTVAYLGKGEVFGLRELVHNWRTKEQRPWSLSLRAVGYVDVLRIPTAAVESLVFPHLGETQLPPALPTRHDGIGPQRRKTQRKQQLDPGLMEFLVEKRLINGQRAMVIDLNRCTRCDDCVRACATAHDNNPRFVRQGPKHDHWMVTNACMHCLDPVCMIGCPTGAIHRDSETGTVLINDSSCIGCGTCANSCPYGNINMVEINDRAGRPIKDQSGKPINKATKCDYCEDQLGGPACQRACPHDALVRVDLTSPDDMNEWSHS